VTELRIQLLSGFRVTVGSRVVPDEAWRRRRPAQLVKLLALGPRHRLHREQAMDALWPDLDPAAASANLRKALHHARHALDSEQGASLLLSIGDVLHLAPERLWVDVDAFRAAVARARETGDAGAYAEAVDLYGNGLLPEDAYESWAIEARDDLQHEFVAALEELAAGLEARRELDGAARAASRLVAVDSLDEDAHARLIRLHALAGRRNEALRQYEHLRRLLVDELGTEPSAQTQRLYEEVRARQPAEPELSAELWERVGELRVVSGDTAGAAKAFSFALDTGIPPEAAARLHRKLADAWLMQFDVDQAGSHLSAAEQLSSDAVEGCRLSRLRATEAWQRGDLDLATRLAEDALQGARSIGSPEDLAAAFETVAIVSHMRGDWREGLLLALAERAAAVRAQAFAWCLLGESLLLQARWDEAKGCLERSCGLHASLGTTSGALPWQRLAELAVCRGTPEASGALLRQASAIATVSPMARHLWGRIHATAALAALEQGLPAVAARSVRAAAAAAARYGDCPSCSALLNPVAAEALAALGDPESASAYAAAARRAAESFASSAWRAMAESAAGFVALAQGDGTRALSLFDSAASLYELAGQPYWASRLAQAALVARERAGNGTPLGSPQIR
jgi:DNA-binding SARP family transcriptional activator